MAVQLVFGQLFWPFRLARVPNVSRIFERIFVRKILVAAVVLSLSACASKQAIPTDGALKVSGGGFPDTSAVQQLREQLVKNAKSSSAKTAVETAAETDAQPGILVIGNVGTRRDIPERVRSAFYQKVYMTTAKKWMSGPAPEVSETDFARDFGAFTAITTWSVPGVISGRRQGLVRVADLESIGFSKSMTTLFFNATGDLVVARTNSDGAVIVDKILCRDSDSDYGKCAAQYTRGDFDRNTGQEIGSDMKPKAGGALIDPTTFRAISASN